MVFRLQEIIHRFEEGAGARYVKLVAILIILGAVGVLYDLRAYRNLSSPEAMDSAQLGRNLAEGKGYTTHFVRPFSMHLLQKHRADRNSLVKTDHPDLANAPVYPLLLAGLMKANVLPKYQDTTEVKRFQTYKPDLGIAIFNQVLLLLSAVVVYLLATRLFDKLVGGLSAVLFVGSELFWRFSASGLSTMWLILVTLGIFWCLAVLEQWSRGGRGLRALIVLSAVTGLLVGVGGLTRYAFGWMIVPVLLYLVAFFGKHRMVLGLAALGTFLLVMAPWIGRNLNVCGLPFGTATFAVMETTGAFPEDRLQRSLSPNVRGVRVEDYAYKLMGNTRDILRSELPKVGGSWISAFFLVGLMVPFKNPTLSRLRWFLVAGMVVLVVAQALGRTFLSFETPEINSENLLVLLAPLIIMFGVSLFSLFLDLIKFPIPAARIMLIVLFSLVVSAPLILALLPPKASPLVYPPYSPPVMQQTAGWMGEREMLMSDIPWAVAWYGKRQCVWVTMNWRKEFYEINDYQKPVQALYLTQRTTDSRFLSNWVRGENQGWATFLFEIIVRKEVPAGFPLRKAPDGFSPDQLFLSDFARWPVIAK